MGVRVHNSPVEFTYTIAILTCDEMEMIMASNQNVKIIT